MRALTLFLLLNAQVLGAQSVATGQYNGGNEFYREGDFEAARRSYLEAVATGIEDARLYYNLGNACFKLSRLGEAVLWYERARRLAPHDEDVEANLHFANLVKKDRETQGDEGSLVEFVVAVYFWPSYDRLSLFFACGFFAVFGLALMRLLSRSKFGTGWLVAILLCGGLSLGAAIWFGTRLGRMRLLSWWIKSLRVQGLMKDKPKYLLYMRGPKCVWCDKRKPGYWCGWPTVWVDGSWPNP